MPARSGVRAPWRAIGVLVLVGGAGCSDYQLNVVRPDIDPDQVTPCGFVEIAGVPGLFAYECNPVFTTTGEPWAQIMGASTFGHTDVFGHPFYQIWYVGADEAGESWSVGSAVSPDGTSWEPHPDNPSWPARDEQAWDAGWVQGVNVVWDEVTQNYVMLYGGISDDAGFFGLGVAASADGESWTLSRRNPVMDLNLRTDSRQYCWPLALTVVDEGFSAYIAGGTGDVPGCEVYRLDSPDPEDWNVPAELVFAAGEEGAWDAMGMTFASVAELDGVQYLFYSGFGGWEDSEDGTVRWAISSFLGLATSHDGGRTFARQGAVPLPVNLTEDGRVGMVAARTVGSRIHLWVGDWYEELEGSAVGYFLYEPP